MMRKGKWLTLSNIGTVKKDVSELKFKINNFIDLGKKRTNGLAILILEKTGFWIKKSLLGTKKGHYLNDKGMIH